MQDQVAAGDLLAEDREQRRREAHHPGDREQQPMRMNIASDEADLPARSLALLRRGASRPGSR